MRIQEERHENEPWLLWMIGNLLSIDSDWVKSFGLAWIFKDAEWTFKPRFVGSDSLFYNAMFFLRVALPFGIFWSVRWTGETDTRAMLQGSIGWKVNGRFTFGVLWLAMLPLIYFYGWSYWYLLSFFALRIQSDKSSAAGVTGPNYGQATGWNLGPH